MNHDRRSALTAIGLALPFALDGRFASATPTGPAPTLRLRSFEESVREAFSIVSSQPWRRIEIGHSEAVLAGLQGCHNDRPFAGFAAGCLRIVRTNSGPGPIVQGVRLYVVTVDVALTRGTTSDLAGRSFDFATVPPAPILTRDAIQQTVDEPTEAARSRANGPNRTTQRV